MTYDLLAEFLTEGSKQISVQPILYNHDYIIDHTEKIPFYESRLETIIKDIGDVKNKSILDFGCNSGFESLSLARLGANVTCVDMIKRMTEMVDFLSKKENLTNIKTISAKFDKFIQENEKQFDVVLALHIMSYSDAKEINLGILDYFSETTYFDLSPEKKYEPHDLLDRKKYQVESLDKFCNECLVNFNTEILESKHTYIVKAARR